MCPHETCIMTKVRQCPRGTGKPRFARATHRGVQRGLSPSPSLSHRGRRNGTRACILCSGAFPGASQCAPTYSPIGACRGAKPLCVLLSSPFPKGGPRGIGSAHRRDCRAFSSHWKRMAHNDICGSGGQGVEESCGLCNSIQSGTTCRLFREWQMPPSFTRTRGF